MSMSTEVGFGNPVDGLVMLSIEDHCGSSDEQ